MFLNFFPVADIGGEPLQCSLMEHFINVTSDDHQCGSSQAIDVGVCGGGCESKQGFCCKPTMSTLTNINLICANGTQITQQVM